MILILRANLGQSPDNFTSVSTNASPLAHSGRYVNADSPLHLFRAPHIQAPYDQVLKDVRKCDLYWTQGE